MGRRATLAWLVAVIAGVFMVVPTLASAQEQGSTEAEPPLTEEVQADDVKNTEAPVAEAPPADTPAEPVEPAEPAPVPEADAPDAGGTQGTSDASKASAESSTSTDAAPASAPAPEPESADVSAVEAKATDSPGNGGSDGAAGRAVARGGGELEATKASSESKPGCLARGGAGEIHNTFPDDGSCAQSLFNNGSGLDATDDGEVDLTLTLNGTSVELVIWSTDGGETINVKVFSGGPVALDVYVKGGEPHNLCTDNNVATGETVVCGTAINPNNGNPFGFSHLDVCVREATTEEVPPPPVVINPPRDDERTPPEDEVLTEEREQREQQEELEEAVPPAVIPTAVTPAPEEALPFTGLDTGWLVLMSLGLLGSGVLLRRKVS